MSIGKRRPKFSRATLQPANPIDIHRGRHAQRRARQIGLGLVAVAVILAAAVVHGFGPPFAFRVGQKADRELRVNVAEFHRKDPLKTNADRQAAEAKVAPRMSHDPGPIRELAEQLDDLVDAVVAAPAREALPEEVRSAWDLDPSIFAAMKSAADTPARREDLIRQIDRAFAPLIRDGVLGPQALPPSEEAHLTLLIRQAGVAGPGHEVHKDRLLPERIKKPDGAVAREFAAAFRDVKLGQALFAMVAERLRGTPTLKYEEAATVRDREVERARVKDAFKTFHAGDVLVAQDERITDDHLALLRLEHETAVSQQSLADRAPARGSGSSSWWPPCSR